MGGSAASQDVAQSGKIGSSSARREKRATQDFALAVTAFDKTTKHGRKTMNWLALL